MKDGILFLNFLRVVVAERRRGREREGEREKDGVGLLDASRRVGPDCEREVREGRERVRAAEQGAEW